MIRSRRARAFRNTLTDLGWSFAIILGGGLATLSVAVALHLAGVR